MSICDDSSGGNELLTIEEGKARIVNFSKGVFYNPVQEFNRDLSVAAISVFSAEHWKHGTSDGSKRDLVQKERRGEKLDVTHHPFSKHGISMNKLEQFIHETNFFKRPESFNYKYSWNIEMLPQVEIHYRDPQIKNALTKACRFFEIVVKPVRRKHGKDSAIMSNTAKNSDRKKQRHLKVYLLLLDFSTLKNNSQNIETLPEMIDSSSNSNEQVTENRLSNILVGAQDSFEVIQSTTEFPEFINNEENVLSKESALEIEKTSGLNGCVSIRNSDKKVIARKRFRIVTQGFYGASCDEGQLLAEKNIVNSQLLSEKSNETMEEEAAADHVKEIQFVLDKPQSLVFEIDKHFNNEDAEDRDIIIYPINGESSLKNTGNSVNNEVIEDVEQSFTKQQSLPGKADEISEEKVEGHSQFVDSKPAGEKYDDGITILEALSASGLRSIRYAKEVPGVKQIFANDISTAAVESIKKNVSCNKVEHLVTTSNVNAISHIYEEKFDVVDLDPYGSASQFLNAAIENLVDGGFLLVTCTDMAVLAGNVPEACYAKYGSMPLRNSACHEMAIRIVLSCIQEHAADYNKYIVPLLSISADFYIRVFVKLHSFGQIEEIAKNGTSLIQQCTGCHTFRLSQQTILNYPATNRTPVTHILDRFCSHCGKRTVLGGPIWSDPIHDLEFVGKMLSVVKSQHFNTMKRMEGMLKLIFEELNDVPLYYTVESLCSKVHCEVLPQVVFHSALLNAGYKVTLSHCAPNSLKTDAPASVIWDIVRCWVKTHPVSKKRLVEGSVALALLQRKPSMIADFTVNSKAISELKMNKVLRYQQNPQPFWGPGCRDRTNYPSEEMKNKRQMNQNKRIKNKKKRKVDDTASLVIKTTPSDNEDTCSE